MLGIESSCDETGAAVVEDGRKILTNVVASSADLHKKTGGIIPEQAARQQVTAIIPVLAKALKGRSLEKINALAVTVGPGLIGSLLVGVETAKTLSMLSGKPLIPVNHVLPHLYANFPVSKKDPEFPALGLVVSGGHTELFFIEKVNKLKWIGGTLDDAAGEAFDKTSRILELGFPGGPAIAAAAAKYKIQRNKLQKIKLPRPMINSDNFNFSFSGLKTAVLREVEKLKHNSQFNSSTIQQLAYEIEESITDVLTYKTLRAAEKYKVKSILLGGGVAANKRLAEKMKSEIPRIIRGRRNPCLAGRQAKSEINLHIPPPSLCTDNAAYIASYAYFFDRSVPWQEIEARPDLDVEV